MDSSSSIYYPKNLLKTLIIFIVIFFSYRENIKEIKAFYNVPVLVDNPFMANKSKIIAKLDESDNTPVIIEKKIIKKTISIDIRKVSAYNAGDINQCDGNPCIAANGEDVCKALEMGYKRCAANFVKFGTILEIEGYGECLVVDRMASRFSQAVDIAFKADEKKEALQFGRRTLEVKIIEYIKE